MTGLQRRQAAPAVPIPTFIPPPKEDITPALIQQSLSVQPQNTALASSIIAHFLDGRIQVFLQLDGPVPTVLVVNASTSLPCGSIGLTDPQPNLALVPLVMNQGQGQPQTVVLDCECIAVNMYQPQIITYWIQKLSDGSVYSVVGNNVVKDIDKMNTTQSTTLTLTPLAPGATKRSASDNIEYIQPEKRQIWNVNCHSACPLYHMKKITGSNGNCGCMFYGADERLHTRALVSPDLMTATMTKEACQGMQCFDSAGNSKPALWHPAHQTCWCITQPYIESNPNAWKPSSSN